MKFIHSLLAKYLLIILVGLIILPFSFPLITVLTYLPTELFQGEKETDILSKGEIEEQWEDVANGLRGKSPSEITNYLTTKQEEYPEAKVFWVNEEDQLIYDSGESQPEKWSSAYTVQFMKERTGGDPFTVVSFIGDDSKNGFVVLEIPRNELDPPLQKLISNFDFVFIIGILLILGLFMLVSLLFFTRIRKRLVHLQEAMMIQDNNHIPYPIDVKKRDEISQLEQSFNLMIDALKKGREREVEEEQLRRNLIANLSHDLRTPLTSIRAHAYSLKEESLSSKGQTSILLIDHKVTYVNRLIENLMSYTLLTAGKYNYTPKKIDIHNLLRLLVASWYPVFEQEGFQIEVNLLEEKVFWNVDSEWIERVFENMFQNVLRHAKQGAFLSISSKLVDDELQISITDRGPGMEQSSEDKGVGIGLAIVSLMTNEMEIDWTISSTQRGTRMLFTKEIS